MNLILDAIKDLTIKIDQLSIINKKQLNIDELSFYTGISKSTIYKMTSSGKIPHYCPTGRRIYFDKNEIDRWLLTNKRKSTQEIEQEAIDYVTIKSLNNEG